MLNHVSTEQARKDLWVTAWNAAQRGFFYHLTLIGPAQYFAESVFIRYRRGTTTRMARQWGAK